MLNSTYLFCEMFCRYFIWIVNNFTTVPFFSLIFLSRSWRVFSVNFIAFALFLIRDTCFAMLFLLPRYNCCANAMNNHHGCRCCCCYRCSVHLLFCFFPCRVSGRQKGALSANLMAATTIIHSQQPTWALLRNIIAQQLCWCAMRDSRSLQCLSLSLKDTQTHTNMGATHAHTTIRKILKAHIK